MNQNYKTTPRLYVDHDAIASGSVISLPDDQTHYLKTVLRLRDGDIVRIFNGRDGEFTSIWSQTGKKQSVVTVSDQLRSMSPPTAKPHVHLFFPPIKKDRLDWLIEKSVELGVTDLHPVLTDHVVVRDIKPDRMLRQIIEASEQCERLTIPTLHNLILFKDLMNASSLDIELFVALERHDAPLLSNALDDISPSKDCGFFLGPEGGFSAQEAEWLQQNAAHKKCHLVSLGDNILRAETAGIYGIICLVSGAGRN